MDILTERRMEFAVEGINWLDVKRFYYRNATNALNYLNDQERAVTVLLKDGGTDNDPDSYRVEEPSSAVVISVQDMFLPIPVTEVINNPNLAESVESVDFEFN